MRESATRGSRKTGSRCLSGRATATGYPVASAETQGRNRNGLGLPAASYRSPKRHAGLCVLGAVGSHLPLSRLGRTELGARADADQMEEGSGRDRVVGATR